MCDPIPIFSIIIPTYRRDHQLFQCLELLAPYFNSDPPHPLRLHLELIVSDDARDQHLRMLLLQRYPWCRYTMGPACGPAANRNNGAHQASGDWLVFTDDDCLPQPGWIEAYAQHMDQCMVMEGKTTAADRRTRLDQECPINETGGYLWSCNFAIKRELFLQLGGFNEIFPVAAMEDVEINYRINKAGFIRKFLPNAEVKHPWRRRNGLGSIRAKAQSIGIYVALHPETASSFSLTSQILNLLRLLKASIVTSFAIGTLQGLPNQITLDTFNAFATWQAVKRVKQSLFP